MNRLHLPIHCRTLLRRPVCCFLLAIGVSTLSAASADADPSFDRIQPILNKYCVGCHNATEREGGLSLQTWNDLQAGGDSGPVIVARDPQQSRLYSLMSRSDEPQMPPEDQPQPSETDVAAVREWIGQGAKRGAEDRAPFEAPRLDPSLVPKPITSLAFDPAGERLAVARFQSIDLLTAQQQLIHRFDNHPGKVSDLQFSLDRRWLVAATGVTGLSGEVWIWNLQRGTLERTIGHHNDMIYAVALSPDGARVATAGYDRSVCVWDFRTGELEQQLIGHNGPVFDLAFHPGGQVLASASGDATIKVWDVEAGGRLDTLGQPLKEQYSVDISDDGRWLIAGGADNRLRVWRLISIDKPAINPLVTSRYAHEQPIQRVRFIVNSQQVVSSAADRTTKLWSGVGLDQLATYPQTGDMVQAFAVNAATRQLVLGRMDGALDVVHLRAAKHSDSKLPLIVGGRTDTRIHPNVSPMELDEQEPNGSPNLAQTLAAPALVNGTIHETGSASIDRDLFRFTAEAGEAWVIEIQAARVGSPLDSMVRVLDSDGQPVPRVLLRAVRDSYFTFRGKDSMVINDFRLHNWEEMRLNQFLYASGEVVKLYHYPRGPDSGFNVYPNFGSRHTFFDTTPIAHALHEPCFVVEPWAPGSQLPPNGLPTFTLYYENDDDSQRRWERDSCLVFTAPHDGDFIVQVEDVRQLDDVAFRYQLAIRRPIPAFRVKPIPELVVSRGAGRRFSVEVERLDGFDGSVAVTFPDFPTGIQVTSPVIVEAGHYRAHGVVVAASDLKELPEDFRMQFEASAEVNGTQRFTETGTLGPIQLADNDAAIGIALAGLNGDGHEIPVIELRPGESASAKIRIDRKSYTGRVGFGKEDALVNSPHGVFVRDTGLNGVLITEDQVERTFSIQIEPWVQPTERWVFVEADVDGTPTSSPLLLRVLGDGEPSE